MIIHRAFIREVLQTVGAVMAILVSIFMAVRVVNILRAAAEGNAPLESVFTLLVLKLIGTFNIIIPLVMFVSILLVQNRWSRDNEMIVIKACGVSAQTFLKPAALLVLIMGAITALFSLYLGPLSSEIVKTIEEDFRTRSDIAGVSPGVFTETRSGRGVYFVESFDEDIQQYKDVFVYNGGTKEGLVTANNGFKTKDQFTQDDFLILKEGTRYEGEPGNDEYALMKFETYALRIQQNTRTQYAYPLKAYASTRLLNATNKVVIGELHWRIAHVLAIPIMTLLALSFVSMSYRESRLPGMLFALLSYFAYLNFLGVAVSMIRRGSIDPHWGLYFVHFIFAAWAIYRFSRQVSDKPALGPTSRGQSFTRALMRAFKRKKSTTP